MEKIFETNKVELAFGQQPRLGCVGIQSSDILHTQSVTFPRTKRVKDYLYSVIKAVQTFGLICRADVKMICCFQLYLYILRN